MESDPYMTTTLKLELPDQLHLDELALRMNLAVHLYQTPDYTIEDVRKEAEIVRNRF